MRRRPVLSFPRLLLATLVCVVGGALLHPTTAAAEGPTAVPSAVAARALGTASRYLPGLSGPVTQAQAAAWHPKGTTATTLTTPGGSTVVLTPAEVRPGSAETVDLSSNRLSTETSSRRAMRMASSSVSVVIFRVSNR